LHVADVRIPLRESFGIKSAEDLRGGNFSVYL
jgi:hypothetical protein